MTLKRWILAGTTSLFLLGSAASETTNEEIVSAFFDAFNAHDVGAIQKLYADDAVVISPENCEPTRGPQAIGASYAAMFSMIPDVQDQLETVISEGNQVALIFVASGTIHGEKFELPISAFMTIEDGLITQDRAFFDTDLELDCGYMLQD